MEKKKYLKPSMQVYDLPGRQMIVCYSGGGLSNIPTVPGTAEDEKHLA